MAQDGIQFVDTPGARLRVRCAGNGPALALVHGWALDLDMWAPQFGALSGDHRLVAFDRRGFGLSQGEPAVERDVEDLLALLDLFRIKRTAVLGMSQGARVAVQFALRASQRVSCLILDGPPRLTARRASDELPMETYRDLVTATGLEAFRKAWSHHPFMRLRTRNPGAQVLLQRIIGRYPGADLKGSRTAWPSVSPGELAKLRTPTLVINGVHDSAERRAAGAELARVLPNAAQTLIAEAAHLPNLDSPGIYNHTVRAFLQENRAASQSAETARS